MAKQELESLEIRIRELRQLTKEAQESGRLPVGTLMEFLTPYHGTMYAQTLAEKVRDYYPWLITAYRMPVALGITVEKTRRTGKVHLHVLPYLSPNLDESSRKRIEENLSGVLNEDLEQRSVTPFDVSFHDSCRDPLEFLRDIASQTKSSSLGTIDWFRDIIDEAVSNPPSISRK